jgi:hypothetical protein
MIENVTNLSSTPALSDPFMPVGAIIVGAIIAGLVGIATNRVNQYFNMRSTKKYTAKVFLSEVKANQNLLQPLSDSLAKVSDSDIEVSEEDKLPNELSFDRTIYSALSDKIGLLDNKCIEKVVQYYVEIKYIEEQYKKFERIHGSPLSDLLAIQLEDEAGRFNYNSNSPRWDEIEEFLRNTEKVYNLGKELTKCLNGEI